MGEGVSEACRLGGPVKCKVCQSTDGARDVWTVPVCAGCHLAWMEGCDSPVGLFGMAHEQACEAWTKVTREFFLKRYNEMKRETK